MTVTFKETYQDPADPDISYEVTSDDGHVNLAQRSKAFGDDIVSLISPTDCRWLIRSLQQALEKAEVHARWGKDHEKACRAAAGAASGVCYWGMNNCIVHAERSHQMKPQKLEGFESRTGKPFATYMCSLCRAQMHAPRPTVRSASRETTFPLPKGWTLTVEGLAVCQNC